jgi:hypothetical protein
MADPLGDWAGDPSALHVWNGPQQDALSGTTITDRAGSADLSIANGGKLILDEPPVYTQVTQFDGVDDYGHTVWDPSVQSFTVAAWVRRISATDSAFVVDMVGSPQATNRVAMIFTTSGTPWVYADVGGTIAQIQLGISSLGTWMLFAATRDAATGVVTSYVNGTPVGVDSAGTGPMNWADIFVGTIHVLGGYWIHADLAALGLFSGNQSSKLAGWIADPDTDWAADPTALHVWNGRVVDGPSQGD